MVSKYSVTGTRHGQRASSTARLATSAATTNATNAKASPGTLFGAQGRNTAAYDVYLVLYNSAVSPPVPGTTVIRKKICLPALAAFALDWPTGLEFSAGIGYALTKLGADADTTAVAVGDVVALNLDYA